MKHTQHLNALGKPSIYIEDFQLWVHGREFPDALDYWDGNWLNVTAHCGSGGVDVWVHGPILHLSELLHWTEACEKLYQTLRGEAILDCMEPALRIEMKVDKVGHIEIRVELSPAPESEGHWFLFAFDQTYLPPLIAQCRDVLRQFPLRGQS